jgi:hypothetical protein
VIGRSDHARTGHLLCLTITKCSMLALPDRYASRDVIAITIVEIMHFNKDINTLAAIAISFNPVTLLS